MLETPLGFGLALMQCPEAMQYFVQDQRIDVLLESQPNPELREVRRTLEHGFAAKFQEGLRWRV